MQGRVSRVAAAVATIAVGMLVAPALAAAGTVEIAGTELRFTAAPGETNNFRLDPDSDGTFIVADFTPVPLTVGAGCTALDTQRARCAAGIASLVVNTGDGDDAVNNATALPSRIDGGDGDDALLGGETSDVLVGGGGNDSLDPLGGLDTVDGGAGDDLIRTEGTHSDEIACGEGADRVFADAVDRVASDCEEILFFNAGQPAPSPPGDGGAPGPVLPPQGSGACGFQRVGTAARDTLRGTTGGDTLLGRAGNDRIAGRAGDDCLFGDAGADRISGGPDRDRLEGGSGDDIMLGDSEDDGLEGGAGRDRMSGGAGADGLVGGAGADLLFGGADVDILAGGSGNDRLSAGGGRNRLSGGSGRDVLRAVNGNVDRVNCGPGRDVARVDRRDRVSGCERVVRS